MRVSKYHYELVANGVEGVYYYGEKIKVVCLAKGQISQSNVPRCLLLNNGGNNHFKYKKLRWSNRCWHNINSLDQEIGAEAATQLLSSVKLLIEMRLHVKEREEQNSG